VNTSLDTSVRKPSMVPARCTTSTPAALAQPRRLLATSRRAGWWPTAWMGSGGIPSSNLRQRDHRNHTPIPIGWQGYGIAMCTSSTADGYAFVSDRNIPGLGIAGYWL